MIDKEKLAAALHKCSVNGEMRYFAPSNVMEEVDGELFNTLEYAARTLQAILPMLTEMVEAREKATQTDWLFENKHVYCDDSTGSAICKTHLDGILRERHNLRQDENAQFIATAANNTAEIGKILGGEEQCS